MWRLTGVIIDGSIPSNCPHSLYKRGTNIKDACYRTQKILMCHAASPTTIQTSRLGDRPHHDGSTGVTRVTVLNHLLGNIALLTSTCSWPRIKLLNSEWKKWCAHSAFYGLSATTAYTIFIFFSNRRRQYDVAPLGLWCFPQIALWGIKTKPHSQLHIHNDIFTWRFSMETIVISIRGALGKICKTCALFSWDIAMADFTHNCQYEYTGRVDDITEKKKNKNMQILLDI